ncbi:sensor domain-containing diguanylate cyclase [Solicola sp. PLA-1-18]|uniref:sensor domain-containing diguanylate cyclase n=1 Tax=Solicola sp. PLA-1-18 TaxID=3380532 RepID=UPI003B7FEA1F
MSDSSPAVMVRSRAVIPFCLAGVVGLATFAVPPYGHRISSMVAAGVLGALLVVAAWRLPWWRWPQWTQDLVAVGFFGVVALVRDASGGSSSGAGQLVVVPALWLALHGTRRGLAMACAATAAVFIVPLVFGDPVAYPVSDWRRAVIFIAAIALVGPAVQSVVRRLALRDVALTRLNDDLVDAGEQWRLFADQLPDTIVLVADQDLRYQLVGGAGVLREGVSGWVGRTLFETSGPDNVAALEPIFRRALDGEPGTTHVDATSSRLPHEVSVVPFSHRGEPGLMVVARDVSDGQRREAELTAAHAHVRRLIDEAPTGICEVDLGGTVLRANQALASILRVDDLVGADVYELGLLQPGISLTSVVAGGPDAGGRLTVERRIEPGDGDDPIELVLHLVPIDGPDRVSDLASSDPAEDRTLVLVHVHDVTEERRLQEQLRHLATRDSLTGLLNRRRFDEILARHLTDCARYGPRGALLLLDLDHFKTVNDTLGHAVGDRVLLAVSEALDELLRDSDTIARLGGDEFAVLVPHGGAEESEVVAARIVDAIRNRATHLDTDAARAVTVSVGVAPVTYDATPDRLLAAADAQLYQAKRNGRDRFESSPPSP